MSIKNEHYPVVVLAGGMGTRLREETEFKPKPLIEIGEYPILWHLMRHYSHFGHQRFIICLGYKSWMIKEYFLNYNLIKSDFTLNLHDQKNNIDLHKNEDPVSSWEITFAETGLETMTGGRIHKIEKYIDSDTFLVTYGDGLSDVDVDKLIHFHHEKGCIATVTGIEAVSRFGVIEADNSHIVEKFMEKPQLGGLISGGFFVFNRKIFDYLSNENCILEEGPMRQLIEDGQLAVYPHKGFWTCMDTYRDYLRLTKAWNKGNPPWKIW